MNSSSVRMIFANARSSVLAGPFWRASLALLVTLSLLLGAGYPRAALAASGAIDRGFQPNIGTDGTIYTVAVQPDGKIVAGGVFTTYAGVQRARMVRLYPDGSVDSSFVPPSGLYTQVSSLAVQPDGKVVAGGYLSGVARIYRFNTDGTLDATFVGVTNSGTDVRSVAIQTDGKIVIGGTFTQVNSTVKAYLARLNSDGTLDSGFNVTLNGFVNAVALQPDGKILIGGVFTQAGGLINRIARLLPSGAIDTAFNAGLGGSGTGLSGGTVYAITVQPDGQILVGGDFTTFNVTKPIPGLVRLNGVNGTLDNTFNIGAAPTGSVRAIALQPDGRLLVGGAFNTFNNIATPYLVRLEPDGSREATFDIGTGPTGTVYAIAMQLDHKIVVGGSFILFNYVDWVYLTRLFPDGSLDMAFNPPTGANNMIRATLVQPDGKILIAGDFLQYDAIPYKRILRLNPDGTYDPTFSHSRGPSAAVNALALQPDGKIIIGGDFMYVGGVERVRMARLEADGTLDSTFNPGAGATGGQVNAVAVLADGKILIGGGFTSYNTTPVGKIARLNSDGTLDTTFNALGSGFNPDRQVNALLVQPADNKIIAAGSFSTYNGVARAGIVRIEADGALDPTFNPGTGLTMQFGGTPTALNISFGPNGKIMLAGDFNKYNGEYQNFYTRLNTDGSRDTSFNIPTADWLDTGANTIVKSIISLPDGSAFIGGVFRSVNNIQRLSIARLTTSGLIDTTYSVGAGANGSVNSMQLMPDGKLLIAGSFTTYNGQAHNRIALLTATGSADSAFNPGPLANDEVRAITAQADGHILVGGLFTQFQGAPRKYLTRLEMNGTNQEPFNIGTGADGPVYAIVVQPDQKILVGGDFKHFNDQPFNNLVRLNTDGSIDGTFNPGSGPDSTVFALALLPNQQILVGGDFTAFDGVNIVRLALLTDTGALDPAFNPGTGPDASIRALAVQGDGMILVGGSFTNFNGLGGLARLDNTGAADASFVASAGTDGAVESLLLLPTGKILIGGQFTTYDGSTAQHLARVNSDGTPDAGFNANSVVNGPVHVLALQEDNRILAGGLFSQYAGVTRHNLARLQATGALDTSFDPSTGPNEAVHAILPEAGGKMLIGGTFTRYSGEVANRMARIDSSLTPAITSALPPNGTLTVPYSHTFTASGFPAPLFTVKPVLQALPPGLTLDPQTGLLSGTPSKAGTFAFTVLAYNGTLPASEQAVSITIDQGQTTTKIDSVSSTSSYVKQSVTVSATLKVTAPVSGTPSGVITVNSGDGNTCAITPPSGSCDLVYTTAGNFSITASYTSDGNYTSSSDGPVAHATMRSPTTTTAISAVPSSVVAGQPITVSFSVTTDIPGVGAPDGSVTVSDGVDSCSAPAQSGACIISLSTFGSRTLTVLYAQNNAFLTSGATTQVTVGKADSLTSISAETPTSAVIGEQVLVKYSVTGKAPSTGTPVGNVTVSDGVNSCSGTVAAGQCSIALTTLGGRTLTATFMETNSYASSSGTKDINIQQALTTTSIVSHLPKQSLPGQAVTVTYSVVVNAPGAGTPTGKVTVSDGVNSCFNTVAAGACQITLTTLGTRTLTATYEGEARFASSFGTATHSVLLHTTQVTITGHSPNPSLRGKPVVVTFSTSFGGTGTPVGYVTISDGQGASCKVSYSTGKCSLVFNTSGDHILTASYGQDTVFPVASSDPVTHKVVEPQKLYLPDLSR